jgi:hypothetical protein
MKKRVSVYIVTGMCCDREGEESIYPQGLNIKSSSAEFQSIYWQCVVVFFATSVRNNPSANHLLCTNAEKLPNLGNFNMEEFFANIGVKVAQLPFTYKHPLEYFHAFRSTYFKFDIVKYLKNNSESNDICMSLDSDCVWVNSVDRMIEAIEKNGIATYERFYPEDQAINGLTRGEMQKIYSELGYNIEQAPPYFGAEFIGGTGENIKKLSEEIDLIWNISLERFAQGKSKFNTEEQMLTYIYNKQGYAPGTANPYLERIWTSAQFYTASKSNFQLDVWHLPAEKTRGIKRLFLQVSNPKSLFWTLPVGEEFMKYVGRYVGIPKRNISKIIVETLEDRKSGIQRRLSHVKNLIKG